MSRVLDHLIRQFEDLLLNGKDRDTKFPSKEKQGEYPYITLPSDAFLEQLEHAVQFLRAAGRFGHNLHIKFIDVGCGLGQKVMLAAYYAFGDINAYGIEIDEDYYPIAKRLCGDKQIIIGDALKHNYADYDIIYFYCPLRDIVKQQALETLIARTASIGTIILQNNAQLEDKKYAKLGVNRLYGNHIFRKDKESKD